MQKVKEDTESATVRLFYNGKELSDDHKIFYYDIDAEKLLHAFIRNNWLKFY